LLTAVDPAALDRAIGAWIAAGCRPATAGWDSARSGRQDPARCQGSQQSPPHLMACLDHVSGVVCAQVAVDGKNNEIPMFAPLLDQIADLTGVLVTADAMHAQRQHATYLYNRSAHYLLTVKGNQPSLRSQLRALPWKQIPAGHTQVGRSYRRIEKRIVKAFTVTEGLLFPACRAGHPDHPQDPPPRQQEMAHRNLLRHHLATCPPRPDFAAYVKACGGDGYRVETLEEFERAFAAALAAGRPTVIDAKVTQWALPTTAPRPGALSPESGKRLEERFCRG
jgi:predicted transposase YbfD/YdcC